MNISRRSFLVGATGLLSTLSTLDVRTATDAAGSSPASKSSMSLTLPPVSLHGYGTLSAAFRISHGGQSSVIHITCESPLKATLTQAKYLSDLERLPGVEKTFFSHRGQSISYSRTAIGGSVACYAHGNDVLILAAMGELLLARLFDTIVPPSATPANFTARAQIPMWLDRWDKYGLIAYFAPEGTPPGVTPQTYDYAESLEFARDNGPMGLALWATPQGDNNGEGLTDEQTWAWVQENAKKMGVPIHINIADNWPMLWLGNRYREQTMLKAPQFLGGFYGVSHDSAGVGPISWLSQEGEDAMLGVLQHTVRRFADDSNIIGWLEPHGETGENPQKYFLESGTYADGVLHSYLRGRFGTLRAVSERWQGDPNHYKSWEEVHIPEIAEFAGFGPDAIDLRGTWRVKYVPAPDGHTYTFAEALNLLSPPPTAPVPAEWYGPSFDDSGWDEFVAPGNDRMLNLPRSPLVYRRTITLPDDWLVSNPTVTLYVWDMENRPKDVTTLYINGQSIAEHAHLGFDQHWSQFDVTSALKPGSNQLTLQMPRAIICYRVYLTKEPPRQYPHLSPAKNAQWVDFVEWIIQSRAAQVRRGAEMIRQVDPHSSINFMAPGDYFEPIKATCQDYGGRFHDTGGMAGFWNEWVTLVMTGARLPVTAEPGNGAPNIREFQLYWGRWLTEGVTGVHYFGNLGEIIWNPEVLKVFQANRALYEAVGKYHVPFAQVAVLYSMDNDALTGFPWDVAAGAEPGGYFSGYNAANYLMPYCPRDGMGMADFRTPVGAKYRAVFDTKTNIISEVQIKDIENYVRGGGVFITSGDTGHHTPLEPESWPITKLTGYAVTPFNGYRNVTPAPGQSVFTTADLPSGLHALGYSLKAVAPSCQTLALWEDGTVAIGLRPLGAGWVVHMGARFWSDQFMLTHGALLRHFGVIDRVPAACTPSPGLHFRHFIGNTGLHDVWVLFNESDNPVTTDLTFLPGAHPASMTDIVSGEKLEVVRDPAGDAVRGMTLAKWESRMYLSPRAEVAQSPLEWVNLQRGWWQGTKTPPAKHLPTPAEQQRFSLDLTEGWAYKGITGLTDDQAAALASPSVDDSHWERRQLDLWLTPGDLTEKRVLLSRKFTVPAHWTSGPVFLCADIAGIAIFYNQARTFLDGKPLWDGRKSDNGPYLVTLGGALKPGTTHLLTLDISSKASLIGVSGPIWLYHLPDPQGQQDLSGTWAAYSDPLHRTRDVQLPGTVPAMFLSRTVTIDPAHRGRNVVMYFGANGIRSVMINGRLLLAVPQWQELLMSFNITPLVLFGAENVIELVGSDAGDKPITLVELRYYDKGVYP